MVYCKPDETSAMATHGVRRGGERIFIGILLDGEARQRIASWQRKNQTLKGMRWKQPQKLHITLLASDWYSIGDLPRLTDAAKDAAHHNVRFTIPVRSTVSWFAPRIHGGDHILIARPGLTRPFQVLHRALDRSFAPKRKTRSARFVPHVTLGKSRRAFPRNSFTHLPAIRIRATHISVVITQQGPHHDAYRIWKRFSLA